MRIPFLALTLGVIAVVFIRPAVSQPPVDYLREIKPILAEKCYSCHGVLKQESSLRLETRRLMVEGGDSGEVIVPGQTDESLLLERVSSSGSDRMPPPEEGSALKPDEIAKLRQWIEQGAEAPQEQVPQGPSEHWAFQRIERPMIPDSQFDHPIDALLNAARSSRGLVSQPPASRSIAIRRLYLDLIGLPPTPRQLADDRPWEQIVDELLANPQHAERWARHWMDVWRYSDWYGLGDQLRNSQKHLWHWRDWIIESLAADKGYDRMVMEMLAGDELAPQDRESIAGTGFLARNYYLFNRTTWLDTTIEHSGKALLGLTLNCAKCHDHKYDPITQQDYYRFRALFEPHQVRLDPLPGATDFEQDGLPRVFDDHVDAKTYLHIRGNPQQPDEENEIIPGVPAVLASFAPPIESVPLPVEAYYPGLRDYVQQDHLQQTRRTVEQAKQQLAAARKALAQAPEASVTTITPADFEFTDDFDQHDPARWQLIGDGWKYADGTLQQTTVTRESQMAKLRTPLPQDFELICRYTTTGGATYKSVTFRFDQSDNGEFANYVYTSAQQSGPKVQVAYTRGGQSAYPAGGRVARAIEVGQPYRIRFAVRDKLVNVWLDDRFMVAYEFPQRSDEGFFSLSAFDATASFDAITIRSLGSQVKLVPANEQPALTKSDAEQTVARMEAKLKAAQAKVQSVLATIAADNARYRDSASAGRRRELAREAALQQTQWSQLQASAELLSATDDKQTKAAKQRLQQARDRIVEIENAGDGDDPLSYNPIRASRKALETPEHKEPDYPSIYSDRSTGRRLALAKWVSSRDNPLTARVAVNHVWMRHFGRPLVESVFDFGLRAPEPKLAEVLDLLAYEFMQSGWSFRHLHRLIVTSASYRLSSSTADADPPTMATDPNNDFYWRMPARRMEAQVVRDSLLQLAGQLDSSIGGPSIDPQDGGTRRSIYFMHSRDQQDRFLAMFDDADLLQCYRRSESIVPQQALALSNSRLSLDMSQRIAQRISKSLDDSRWRSFVEATFEWLLCRPATDAECDQSDRFYEQMVSLLNEHQVESIDQRIRSRFVHAILNHNDFISIR